MSAAHDAIVARLTTLFDALRPAADEHSRLDLAAPATVGVLLDETLRTTGATRAVLTTGPGAMVALHYPDRGTTCHYPSDLGEGTPDDAAHALAAALLSVKARR